MGDIADMMLDGTLCEGCGEYLEGSLGNFPQRCPACQMDTAPPAIPTKIKCPKCGKRVKAVGLKDHDRDAHG